MSSFVRFIKSIFPNLLKSGMQIGVVGTGVYVYYTDSMRYTRMMDTYSHGQLLPPFDSSPGNTTYFSRPELEKELKELLSPTMCNQYYLLSGHIGSGKTRTVVEVIRDLMNTCGSNHEGAPIFVMASQGRGFANTLAAAVDFRFDEHLSFKFFADYLLQIQSFPGREDQHKLARVLEAIEESASIYLKKTGKPAVIVIDGLEWLNVHNQDTIHKLEEKAKLWADTNIAKLVLITHEAHTIELLQRSKSAWSRAANPIKIGDLANHEAVKYLMHESFRLCQNKNQIIMSEDYARKVVDVVGGRVHHLIVFKRDFQRKVPFETTAARMIKKEQEKLQKILSSPNAIKAFFELKKNDGSMYYRKLLELTSKEALILLVDNNIIRFEHHEDGILVKYESKLMFSVAKELHAQ